MHQCQASQRFRQLMPYSIGDTRTSWDLTAAGPCWAIFTLYVRQCIRGAGHGGAKISSDNDHSSPVFTGKAQEFGSLAKNK